MNWIGRLYYWFWHDVLCRVEPFTFQWRRSVGQDPVWWFFLIWTSLGVGLAIIFHLAGWF